MYVLSVPERYEPAFKCVFGVKLSNPIQMYPKFIYVYDYYGCDDGWALRA